MKAFVVMGNDFPAGVFDSESSAEAYCERRRKDNKPGYTKIYWRVYAFTLNQGEKE